MLAKTWKKFLMIICILAILFNVVHKLVVRTSLKEQLQSVVGGEPLFHITEDKDGSSNTGSTGTSSSATTQSGNGTISGTQEINTQNSNQETIYNNQGGTSYYTENGENNSNPNEQSALQENVQNAMEKAGEIGSNVQNVIIEETEEQKEINRRGDSTFKKYTDGVDTSSWNEGISRAFEQIMQSSQDQGE